MINVPSMSSQSPPEYLLMDRLSLERLSLDRLPTELLQSILSELDSISSLRCTILACRVLYKAGTTGQVISNVLFQQLDDDDVRHQAIATWRIQQLPCPAPMDECLGYLDDFLKSETSNASPLSLTIKQAAELERLNSVVRELSFSFIEASLSRIGQMFRINGGPDVEMWSASTTEMTRVKRAFYLAECYYILFRNPSAEIGMGVMIPSFLRGHLAAWEVEVLNCIDKFLQDKLFDEISISLGKTVKWGFLEAQDPFFEKRIVGRTLSFGLNFIQRALASETRKTWNDWLHGLELSNTMLTYDYPDLSERGLRYDMCGTREIFSSAEEMTAALSPIIDLTDDAHINEQTDTARQQSPFVFSSDGYYPSIIGKWLQFFAAVPLSPDDIFFKYEYTLLSQYRFAIWDSDRITTLQEFYRSPLEVDSE